MNNTPLVSVIIPVYNRENFIAASIQSILDQTYQHFEIIIVDDASSDKTINRVNNFKDKRINLMEQSINKGVSATFNFGAKKAKGRYIARLDSDDVANPNRIEKQVNYLQNNPEIAICGSWLQYLNSDLLLKFPSLFNEIVIELLIKCPLSIGTSMFKKEVFEQLKFNESLRYGEDYEFWCRALFVFKAYNLKEPLVLYRSHKNQLSVSNKQQQLKDDSQLRLNLFKKLEYDQNLFPDGLILKFLESQSLHSKEFLLLTRWFPILKKNNYKLKIFPKKEFLKKTLYFENKLHRLFFFHPQFAPSIREQIKVLFKIPINKAIEVSFKKIRIWMK